MAWQLLSEIYLKMEHDRKEHSVPGSTPSSPQQLFGKEELATVTMASKVNTAGKGLCKSPFRCGFGGFRFRGGFRSGKGKGATPPSEWQNHVPSQDVVGALLHPLNTMEAMVPNSAKVARETRVPKVLPPHKLQEQQILNLPLRLRQHLRWWRMHKAGQDILNLILAGVCPDWPEPKIDFSLCHRDSQMVQEALAVMADYVEVGAAHRVPLAGTRFLIPWFLLKKPEGGECGSSQIAGC